MQERNTSRLFIVLAASVLLTLCCMGGCAQTNKKVGLPPLPAPDENIEFTETEIPVIYDADYSSTATLRFYDDMPHVPYISAQAFHEIMWPETSVSLTYSYSEWC